LSRKGWRIRGVVQGVGFRYFVMREARRNNLKGYVKNLPDCSVEVAAVGSDPDLKVLEKAISLGPPQASVYSVITFEPPAGLELKGDFDIEY
jgi:acylphosphatase